MIDCLKSPADQHQIQHRTQRIGIPERKKKQYEKRKNSSCFKRDMLL